LGGKTSQDNPKDYEDSSRAAGCVVSEIFAV
jgi:hypothetical protein